MIKKSIFFILFTIYYLLFTIDTASAASNLTPTSTDKQEKQPKSTDNDLLNQQINNLKSRIASRVAQLKLVEKRGIIGVASDISDTQITISDLKNNTRFIDVDELTRFSSPNAKGPFGISDITKGTKIGVLGLYNKESRRTLARFVNVLDLPKIIHGEVILIDSKNYTLKVLTEDNKEIVFNVETTTKTLSYSKDGGLNRSGFSKITEDERVIVILETDSKNRDEMVASKIILLPDIPKNPKIN